MNRFRFPDAFSEKPRLDGGRSIGEYSPQKTNSSKKKTSPKKKQPNK